MTKRSREPSVHKNLQSKTQFVQDSGLTSAFVLGQGAPGHSAAPWLLPLNYLHLKEGARHRSRASPVRREWPDGLGARV